MGEIIVRELLNAALQRRLQILVKLSEQPSWISSAVLAKQNDASLRTTLSDIQYLKENWEPILTIETSKKNGVRLVTPPNSHLKSIYATFLRHSEEMRFFEKIFFEPNLTLEEWGERLFISESSLYRFVRQSRKALKDYGVYLSKRPCKIMSEQELYARCFYMIYFQESYNTHEWPFKFSYLSIVRIAQKLFKAVNLSLDDGLMSYFIYYLAVSLVRFTQGERMPRKENVWNEEKFNHFHQLIKEDLTQLVRPLSMEPTLELVKDLYFSYQAFINPTAKNKQMAQALGEYLEKIQRILGLALSPEQANKIVKTCYQVYHRQQIYPFKKYILFNQQAYNGYAVLRNYPFFSKIAAQELEVLEAETGFPWFTQYKTEILYWLVIKWRDLPQQIENRKPKVAILVLSDLGKDHAALLTKEIQHNFSQKIQIETYQESILLLPEQDELLSQKYDLFISTFASPLLPKGKTILVDAIPSNADWANIRKAINSRHNENEFDLNYPEAEEVYN